MFNSNIGKYDKRIRGFVAITLSVLIVGEVVTDTIAIVLLVAASSLVVTSLFKFCSFYRLLGVSTCRNSE
jgi:hypothetical protein